MECYNNAIHIRGTQLNDQHSLIIIDYMDSKKSVIVCDNKNVNSVSNRNICDIDFVFIFIEYDNTLFVIFNNVRNYVIV